jgi:predicted O-methyltransferase YrrM
MTKQLWTSVDNYITDSFVSIDPVMKDVLATSESAGLPSIIWLARGLASEGTLIPLEASPKHAEVARANIVRAGLANTVEVQVGPALDTLPQLVAQDRGPFNLILIDANKDNYPEYLVWALKLSRQGTLIVADNVIRDEKILDPTSNDPLIQGTRRLNQLLAEESRVKATVIQTVGGERTRRNRNSSRHLLTIQNDARSR